MPAPTTMFYYDAPVYLSIAYDIEHYGRFTDGSGWDTPRADPARPSGMIRSPLYPIFLAEAAKLDLFFNHSLDCSVQNALSPTCPQRAPLPRAIQLFMTGAVYLMLWRIALRATGSLRVAWLSLVVGLMTAPILIHYAETLMTETFCLFFTTSATLAGIETVLGRRPVASALISGTMIGMATLTRPNFLYFLPAIALVTIPLIIFYSKRRRGDTIALIAFLAAGLFVISPWIIRNAVVMGDPAMTSKYAQLALTQRVAYDEMDWRQYAVFSVCSLPDGAGMGSLIVKPNACKKYGYEITPDTFYGLGSTTILNSNAVVNGGTSYVVYHYIIQHPIWHAIVSVPMAMRRLWIDHYWGFVLTIFCFPLTLRAIRKCDAPMVIVTLPGWFMLAFYALLSADQQRYNLMLIIPFSTTGGIMLEHFLRRNLVSSFRPFETISKP
jgi:4-amino-4-deoxy-L-arabinose transferase-like glycosyltransferase